MGKLYNRTPLSVNVPSNSDTKEYYFTNAAWKGFTNNKNILTVDQETFSSCNNVYVDKEGLLSSRPSVKKIHVPNAEGGELTDITKAYSFDDVLVYENKNSNDEIYLTFVKNDIVKQIRVSDTYKLILSERKIFIFELTAFRYYDVVKTAIYNAENFIHVPVLKTVTNGTEENLLEDENEFTKSYVVRYIWTKFDANVTNLIGKNVTISIQGVKYTFDWVKDSDKVLVKRTTTLSDANFAPTPQYTQEHLMISVSDVNNCILCEYRNGEYYIYYSSDMILYTELELLTGILTIPKLSKDGKYVYAITKDAPYILSVLAEDEGAKLYPEWKDLLNLKSLSIPVVSGDTLNDKCEIYLESDENFTLLLNYVRTSDYGTQLLNYMYRYYNGEVYTNVNTYDGLYVDYAYLLKPSGDIVGISDGSSYTVNDRSYNFSGGVYLDYGFKPSLILSDTTKLKITIKNIKVSFIDDDVVIENGQIMYGKFTCNVDVTLPGSSKVNYTIPVSKHMNEIEVVNTGHIGWAFITSANTDFGEILFRGTFTPFDDSGNYVEGKWFGRVTADINFIYNPIEKIKELDPFYRNVNLITAGPYSLVACGSYIYMGKNGDGTSVRIPVYRDAEHSSAYIYQNERYGSIHSLYLDAESGKATIFLPYIYTKLNWEEVGYVYKRDFDYVTKNDTITKIEDDVFSTFKVVYNGDDIVTRRYLYKNEFNAIPLITSNTYPVSYNNGLLVLYDSMYLYNSNDVTLDESLTYDELIEGEIKYFVPKHVTQLDNYYLGNIQMKDVDDIDGDGNTVEILNRDKTLFISAYPSDGEFKWYFPKRNTEELDYAITALHNISQTEILSLSNKNSCYIQHQRSEDSTSYAYLYYNSKLQTGCIPNGNVINTSDGKYVIFPSSEGLCALTYQDFVASTEQVASHVSDAISTRYDNFVQNGFYMLQHEYWIYCHNGTNELLLYDTRNNSWWSFEFKYNIDDLFVTDNKVHIVTNGKCCKFDTSRSNYYDVYDVDKCNISWDFTSQKLHLNSLNYTKHISSITLTSVIDDNCETYMDLIINNYRKSMSTSKIESFKYDVNSVRTFVKRLNYYNVNEFQYTLSSDNDGMENPDASLNVPLSLSNITIKYKISRQVR